MMRQSLLVASVLVFALAAGLLVFLQRSWNQPVTIDEPVFVHITPGESLTAIASKLENQGVIQSNSSFELLVRRHQSSGDLKSGEYQFQDEVTPISVFETLLEGEVTSYKIQFIEGQTFDDYLDVLRQAPRLKDDIQTLTSMNAGERFPLAYGFDTAEGHLFPDTYYYEVGATASSVILRSMELMEQELQSAWDARSEQVSTETKEQLLVVASLIEKETNWPDDRERVSGVIHRRLAKQMRLQLDPTVIYALGDQFDGNLRKADLDTPSPYNTYMEYGLPPTPICSPSQASLIAAAQPNSGKELYFVARGDGTSEFSNTLSQHNRAVRKYQR